MTGRGASRALLVVAGAGAAIVLALAGATGSVLRSDWLLEQVDADPDSLFVSFTGPRASLVPGRIRFATLVVRSQDSNVQWEARLEDVSVNVALTALARRRFHATSVRAATLNFRLREKLTPEEATPARTGRYPRIAGFSDPPRRDPPQPAEAAGNPWRVVVDDLRVDRLRGIWIDAWRWEGEGDVSGGFRLRPGIEAQVLPSEVRVAAGTLHWGRDLVSRETTGHVAAALPRFDTQEYPGNEVWKIMSGSASLGGTLDAVPFLSPEGGGPRLLDGRKGSVRARVALEYGKGRARLDARSEAVVARVAGRTLRGSVQAEVFASRLDFPGGTADFGGTRVRLRSVSRVGAADAPWNGTLAARHARLGLADGSLDAHLSARLGDGRPLLAFLPSGPPKWIAGLLDLRDFEATGRMRAAQGSLALSPARADAGTFSVDADWRKVRDRSWGALLVRKGALSLGVGVRGGATSLHLAGAPAWFAAEGRPGGLRTDQPRGSEGAVRPIK